MSVRQPLGLALLFAGTMFAADASAAPGDHIRTGALTIVPRVGLGFDYRSNAFRGPNQARGTGRGTIVPGVNMSLDNDLATFGFDAHYVLQKHGFLTNNPTQEIRGNRISSLDRFNNFGVNLSLDVFKKSPVGLMVSDDLQLRNNPSSNDINSDDPYTTFFRNGANIGLHLRPGAALQFTPGFTYNWSQFFIPESDAQRDPFNTRNYYGPSLNVQWKFLPRTNFVFNGTYGWNRWNNRDVDVNGAPLTINDSRVGRATVGVQGRLTERLRVVAKAGWGFANYVESAPLTPVDGILVGLQADYLVSDKHTVGIGYRKSFFDSFFTNSVATNSIYGSWKGTYGDKFHSTLGIGTRFENYDGPIDRNDQVTNLSLGLQYDLATWCNLSAGAGWLQRASVQDDGVEYDDVNVKLGATFVY